MQGNDNFKSNYGLVQDKGTQISSHHHVNESTSCIFFGLSFCTLYTFHFLQQVVANVQLHQNEHHLEKLEFLVSCHVSQFYLLTHASLVGLLVCRSAYLCRLRCEQTSSKFTTTQRYHLLVMQGVWQRLINISARSTSPTELHCFTISEQSIKACFFA